jgi:hypothetical protein
MRIGKNYCSSCNRTTRWNMRHALLNTLVGFADFIGDKIQSGKNIDRGRTSSRSGPAKRVSVFSCSDCGKQVTT